MTTATRPYIVTDEETGEHTLVDAATSQAHAIRQVVGDRYSARPATAAEVLAMLRPAPEPVDPY